MAIFDRIRGELVDIVEWLDDSRDTIVWCFPRYNNEIKMGARLIVRESQVAVFVNEGVIADAFPPGTYTLQTQNMPVLSTLKGWRHGLESPFKAEVYFVGTRQFTDMKWGTQNPVMLRDPEFGPVRLRAFGGFALRVVDAPRLLTELAGTDPRFRTEEVADHLRQLVVSRLGTALATAASETPVLDLAAHQQAIGERLAQVLTADLAGVGIEIPRFIIENISLPPEVEEALDKRTEMGIVGDLGRYSRFQAANALEEAARNPGGGAGEGLGLGLGIAAGQRMASALSDDPRRSGAPPAAPAEPPPLPDQEQWYLGAGGERRGPFDLSGLAAEAGRGTLTGATLVWRTGMAQWTPAAQVPELAPAPGEHAAAAAAVLTGAPVLTGAASLIDRPPRPRAPTPTGPPPHRQAPCPSRAPLSNRRPRTRIPVRAVAPPASTRPARTPSAARTAGTRNSSPPPPGGCGSTPTPSWRPNRARRPRTSPPSASSAGDAGRTCRATRSRNAVSSARPRWWWTPTRTSRSRRRRCCRSRSTAPGPARRWSAGRSHACSPRTASRR
jgi:membrane protease subunit (stomatin/prohibitin family)